MVAFVVSGCAGRPAETPKEPTKAPEPEVAVTTSAPATPPPMTTMGDKPPGELVCRTEKPNGAAMELFVQWDEGQGRGVLKETAVTGMTHERRVRVEKDRGLVVADDPREQDLVTHAAVVAEKDGKKLMKVDDNWAPCR